MSDANPETLGTEALRAVLRHFAALQGLTFSERPAPEGGLHALLSRKEGEGEVYFAVAPAGSTYLSLSLVLVVDEDFFRENSKVILDVTSRYEVCVTLSGDETLAAGEVYLNLSLRIFRDGLTDRVFDLALSNLSAAKDALAEEFPSMRAVVIRVSEASVRIDGETVAAIDRGLLVLLGVAEGDDSADATALARKIVNLRIFPDDHRPLNRSLLDTGGEVLAVSQFTLLADTSRGRRPSFVHSADPEVAEPLYGEFVAAVGAFGPEVKTGRFGASMQVASVNDGPVTVLLSTRAEDKL